MKKSIIKNWKKFNESDKLAPSDLYDDMGDLLRKANILICREEGTDPDEWELSHAEEAMELLSKIDSDEARQLYDEIETKENEIDEIESELNQ